MSQKSKKREAAKLAEKNAERRSIEMQYSKGKTENVRGLRLGELEPRPVPKLGSYSFLSLRKHNRYVQSVRRGKLADEKPAPPK